jgi:hypothetical protein
MAYDCKKPEEVLEEMIKSRYHGDRFIIRILSEVEAKYHTNNLLLNGHSRYNANGTKTAIVLENDYKIGELGKFFLITLDIDIVSMQYIMRIIKQLQVTNFKFEYRDRELAMKDVLWNDTFIWTDERMYDGALTIGKKVDKWD